MKKEFLIDRQGKQFVLYAGLLNEAHEKGLKAIRTRLVQNPLEVNGQTTIVHAEVELEDGRVFTGIGDATPQNVGPNIRPHAIRMAETRAKARALRDALNINAVSLEELGDEEPPAPSVPRKTAAAFDIIIGQAEFDRRMEERRAPERVLPSPKPAYSADELRAYRDAGKAPPNLESAAVRFADDVFEVTKKAIAVPKAEGLELLVWLIDLTAKWEASPKNPRNPQAAPV